MPGNSPDYRKAIYAKTGGVCYYCGVALPSRWHIDHVEPILRECGDVMENGKRADKHPERDIPENKVPACISCNRFKATFSLEFWRSEIESQVERLRSSSAGFKALERFGIIEIKEPAVTFWFEKDQQPRGRR